MINLTMHMLVIDADSNPATGKVVHCEQEFYGYKDPFEQVTQHVLVKVEDFSELFHNLSEAVCYLHEMSKSQ